jgi:hypothetical protein
MKTKKLTLLLLTIFSLTNLLTSCTETNAQEIDKVLNSTESVEKPFLFFNESESLVKTRLMHLRVILVWSHLRVLLVSIYKIYH